MIALAPTPVWLIAAPLLLAFASPLWGRLRMPLLFGAYAALFALALSFFPAVAVGPLLETIVIAPPLGIHLHVDSVSLLLVALFNFAGGVVALFLWLGGGSEHLRGRGAFVLLLLLIAGCNGMILTGDLFNLYVFLEITGVSAYVLSALRQDGAALEAGLKFLIIGSVAAVFFLFAVVLIYLQTGSLNMAAVAATFGTTAAPLQLLIVLLMLVGLGIKAELFPFNFWVPDIYRGSDPAAASLFSGVVVKAFLFVLFHLVFLILADPALVQTWLMALGATTMLIAEWTALRQRDMRRMLAYSSLGQIGLIAMALGFGTTTVTAGALFHMVNHTLIKLLLFLIAALILQRLGTARIDKLAGMARQMPVAAGLFVLGSLAVLGLPPTNGFISKFWILEGLAAEQVFWPIAVILLAAMLEAGYYFRWIAVFYRTEAPAAAPIGTANPLVHLPLLVLGALILVLGIAPFLIDGQFVDAARDLLGRAATLQAVLGVQP